ncbi:MAG: GNAT family N-acetyltransferase [Hamadaea sp.]|uniref:GNAT family N-acetyltransferase n=1 Tax=Hamadaea sp. TaxID=2024425 RepID=UPI0018224437|nr:GNAT family N-acetyltransferase [Hamadaea sp.]NUR72406.1 GNAT family N-acetyltransferase [Hamadaea sp.]NUT22156.1 GNAT family N-acetyltransferase [Hamadaea sp.]
MVLALSAHDIGSRVVVRRRVQTGERPLYTDLLGELTELTPTEVVILTSRGAVRVPVDEIHRAKPVPPRRGPTAREIAEVERAATRAWPPAELAWLGDWRLRAAEGYTGRANSALPIGNPGVPLSEAIDQVVAFYRERELPPQIDVPLPLATTVQRELIKAGWHEECAVRVQTVELDRLIAATDAIGSLATRPSPAAYALIEGRRGPLPEAARHVLTAVPTLSFCEYADSSGLLAMGRGSVTSGGHIDGEGARWLGLFAIETVPAARRRGLAQRVVGRLARWGREHGATKAFLQVESTNEAALELYAKLGFTTQHSYVRYRLY